MKNNDNLNNSRQREKIWAILIIAIIIGLLSGAISSLYFFSTYGFSATEGGLGFISKKERASRLGQFFDNQITKELNQSLVGIYLKKQGGSDVLSQIYLSTELKGQGIVLTSDGWVLTTNEVTKNMTPGQLVVVFEQKAYQVDKLLIDTASEAVFVHIVKNDNRNWPVAKITTSPNDLLVGQAVLAINSQQEIIPTNIKNLHYSPLTTANSHIKSTDIFSTSILIKDELANSYLGAPIINLTGEVIGLATQSKAGQGTMVIPVSQFDSVIDMALKNNEVKRPSLGINYIDLSQVSGVEKIGDLTGPQLYRGALVYTIAYNSPAAKAGLAKGDIILKVDNEQVNHQKSLTDLIQDFKPNTTVKLLILRNSLDREIEVVLGE